MPDKNGFIIYLFNVLRRWFCTDVAGSDTTMLNSTTKDRSIENIPFHFLDAPFNKGFPKLMFLKKGFQLK